MRTLNRASELHNLKQIDKNISFTPLKKTILCGGKNIRHLSSQVGKGFPVNYWGEHTLWQNCQKYV